jgi:hypothetical protein
VRRKKRKVVMATVPARNESPELSARTSCSVAEVGRQHLASNKLACSAPKRVAIRVNGGLARRSHRRESVGGGVGRKDDWRVGLHRTEEWWRTG